MMKEMKGGRFLFSETGTEDGGGRRRKTALPGASLRAVAPCSASLPASVCTTHQADRTPRASFPSSGPLFRVLGVRLRSCTAWMCS
jgi:hypothetical protein